MLDYGSDERPGFGYWTAGLANGPVPAPNGAVESRFGNVCGWCYETDFSTNPAVGAVGSGMTFQVLETYATCNVQIANTAHATMQVTLGDASVRSVSQSVSLTTWVDACMPADGTPLGSDW